MQKVINRGMYNTVRQGSLFPFRMMSGLVLLIASLFSAPVPAAGPERLHLYSYHDAPPFVVDQATENGLTYDLARYLTRASGGAYVFDVRIMPRKRLNELLVTTENGIVPWVNKIWFGDREETKYLWSPGYFEDSESIVSPADAPFEFTGASSLFGKRVGTVAGYRYPSIDDHVAEGRIERHDVRNQLANIRMLIRQRNDVAFMPRSTADYLLSAHGLAGQVHFSEYPESVYSRQFLIMNKRTDIRAFLVRTIKAMDHDWIDLVAAYQ